MKKLFFAITFFTFLLNVNYAQNEADVVIFTVGDESVTLDEFLFSFQKNNQLSKTTPEELRDYLDLYVNFKLKVKEGKLLQIDTSKTFQRELASYRQQSAQQYLTDREVSNQLIDEAIERMKYYIRASHIMISVDPDAKPEDTLIAYNKALDIRSKVLGGMNFAEAAVAFSDDPSAKDIAPSDSKKKQYGNKGDLNYFTVFNLIYPFENGAYNTPIGQVSMPIRTDFGYHIIYVQDKMPALETIEVSHIFIPDSLGYKKEMTENTKAKLAEIQNRLKNGDSFEMLVKEYSEDQVTKGKEGRLEPFAPNRRPGDFVKAAVSLQAGEVSQPVATVMGWHLIKLHEIVPVSMEEHEANYFAKSRISRDKRSQLSRQSFVNRLKREFQYKETGKNKAIQFFNKNLPDAFFQSGDMMASQLKGIDKLKPMATFAGQDITVIDYANYLSRFRGVNLTMSKKDFLEDRYNAFVEEKLINYENTQLEAKYPEFKELMNEYNQGMILYEVNSQEVWGKAMTDSAGLAAFYENIKTDYPVDEPNDSIQYKPFQEVRALIITRYQDHLDKIWVKALKEKYPVIINEDVYNSILKK